MEVVKTKEEAADFLKRICRTDCPLAAQQEAGFPFAVRQESASVLAICNSKGLALCRYKREGRRGEEPFPPEEIRQLEDIIRLISAEALAAADETLRATAAECDTFRKSLIAVWKTKAADDLMARSALITRTAKADLREDLAIALFGRAVKKGIIHLHRVTSGKNYYDRRFYHDPGRLKRFGNMPSAELVRLLAPSPFSEAPAAINIAPPPIFPGGEPWKSRGQGRKRDRERQEQRVALTEGCGSAEAAAPLAASAPLPKSGKGSLSALPRNGGFDEYPAIIYDTEAEAQAAARIPAAAMPLPHINSAAVEDDSYDDTELFSEPVKPHAIGTLKHKAVADKLCAGLSPIFFSRTVGTIYKFHNPIEFEAAEEFPWGKFKEDEVSYLNQALADLQKADSVLVEYRLPPTKETAGQGKRIDVVAYYTAKRTLRIIDWKFGRIPVGIDNNPQLNSYVRRLLADFTENNHDKVKWIEIFIIQPNGSGETKRKFLNKDGQLQGA